MNKFKQIKICFTANAFCILFLTLILMACSDEQLFIDDLKQIAKNVNEKCPRMIDSETRLDGLEIKEPNTLVYKYTLVNASKQNLDTIQFYQSMWPGILSFIKVSKELQKLRDHNTQIQYLYKDKNNQFFYLFKINPNDYNKK